MTLNEDEIRAECAWAAERKRLRDLGRAAARERMRGIRRAAARGQVNFNPYEAKPMTAPDLPDPSPLPHLTAPEGFDEAREPAAHMDAQRAFELGCECGSDWARSQCKRDSRLVGYLCCAISGAIVGAAAVLAAQYAGWLS